MSEHRFRELDQAWERSQANRKPRPMIRPTAMTIRWWRRACDDEVQFVETPMQDYLVRAWRTLNAFQATRLRVFPK